MFSYQTTATYESEGKNSEIRHSEATLEDDRPHRKKILIRLASCSGRSEGSPHEYMKQHKKLAPHSFFLMFEV